MSAQDVQPEKGTAARDALLDAITERVGQVKGEPGGLTAQLPHLKQLAQIYALVVHGKE
jgi:hypothetical protein